jgi:hypothetical protein
LLFAFECCADAALLSWLSFALLPLPTQYDVALLQNIEVAIDRKLVELKDVAAQEELVLRSINQVSEAQRSAQLKLEHWGFDEKVQQRKQRSQRKGGKAASGEAAGKGPNKQATGRSGGSFKKNHAKVKVKMTAPIRANSSR